MAEFSEGRNWIDKQLQRRVSALTVFGIPLAILAFDWGMRFAAQGDLSDAPADLCMLAVVGFSSIMVNDVKQYRDIKEELRKAAEGRLVVDVFTFLVFAVLWFVSLVLVSSNHWLWQTLSVPVPVRVGIAAIIGIFGVAHVVSLLAGDAT